MFRVRPALLVVFISALVAAGCGDGGGEDDAGGQTAGGPTAPATAGAPPPSDPSEPAPSGAVPETLAFTAPTVDGGELDGADLAGTPVAFWFWAAWCPRCAAAAGDVRDVQAEYDGRVQVVGVAGLESGEDAMRRFVDQHQLDGFPHLADDEGQVWQKFGVTTQEYFVILDSAGNIVHDGPLSASALRDQLATLAG
jgi:peroxiredoxin